MKFMSDSAELPQGLRPKSLKPGSEKKEREKVKKIWQIWRNSYLCNPNRKGKEVREEKGMRSKKSESEIQVRLKREWGERRGKEILTILKFFESLEATALRILSK